MSYEACNQMIAELSDENDALKAKIAALESAAALVKPVVEVANVRRYFVGVDCRGHEVCVEWRGKNYDGSDLWAVVTAFRERLCRNGGWSSEPLPSSRTDAFIAGHSWPTFAEAMVAGKEALARQSRARTEQQSSAPEGAPK